MKRSTRISSIEIFKADLELKEPFRTSLAEISCANNIIVRVYLQDGLYGTGEARPNPPVTGETQGSAFIAGKRLSSCLIGKDALDIENRMAELDRHLTKNSALKSAFDIALYDLLGKTADLPLYAVLGGSRRSFWTDNTVSIGLPEVMARKACEYKEQGFKALKVKLGGIPAVDIARIHEIRKMVGIDIPIRIDANQGWNFKQALKILTELEQMNIDYCEQPLVHWDHANMRRLKDRVSIPIMADESLFGPQDAFKLAADGCCDLFNIKLAKSGGIHNGLKINAIGEGAGIACMAGCMTETRLALTAAAHLVSARPNIMFCDLDGHTSMKIDPVSGGAEYKAGEILLPVSPGHGADFDPHFLDTCESIVVE